jgi:hypothetical protein
MRQCRQILAFGVVALIVATGAVTPSSATLYCEIAGTRDGFAALRAAPDRNSRIVMKVKPELKVLLDPLKESPQNAKQWVAVSVVIGEPKRTLARGWLHKSLIKPDSCG